ncbi:uncharacterized protein LOC100905492 [Galendromus occidentalis]|uniref:Uncharacterized protein LOC100905492 n=1 Tax=Galendromus occidentalis TaxID=34638 RepID=A0AAJ6QVN6_9ACAR|nr:uncharacterized protein LOC100905492 [Galendromus occidentalis]
MMNRKSALPDLTRQRSHSDSSKISVAENFCIEKYFPEQESQTKSIDRSRCRPRFKRFRTDHDSVRGAVESCLHVPISSASDDVEEIQRKRTFCRLCRYPAPLESRTFTVSGRVFHKQCFLDCNFSDSELLEAFKAKCGLPLEENVSKDGKERSIRPRFLERIKKLITKIKKLR